VSPARRRSPNSCFEKGLQERADRTDSKHLRRAHGGGFGSESHLN